MPNAGSKKQHAEPDVDGGGNSNSNSCPFLSLAGLILPWLTPQELAAISCTCKTLNQISKSITLARSSDACRSLENVAIPFVNAVDSHPYAYFLYAPSKSSSRQFWGGRPTITIRNPNETKYYYYYSPDDSIASDSSGGCNCGEKCVVSLEEEDDHQCPCSNLSLRGGGEVVTECGPSCRCGPNCGNRSTQKGVSVKLKVVRDKKKGWGLFADQLIGRGEFVCEYVGELVTTQEARRRQKEYDELRREGVGVGVGAGKKKKLFSSALLVVREHLPSGKACFRINIDATRIGNVARFINHSCDGGNLSSVLVRVSGSLMPRVCFFASRDIGEGEELCFSYGDISCLGGLNYGSQGGLNYCCCGSHCCYGVLPSENT